MFVQTRSSISAGVAQGAAKLPFNWRSLTRGLRQRRVKRAAVLTALCAFAALLGLAILAGVREHRVSRLQSYLPAGSGPASSVRVQEQELRRRIAEQQLSASLANAAGDRAAAGNQEEDFGEAALTTASAKPVSPSDEAEAPSGTPRDVPVVAMIAKSAELTISVKGVAAARASLDAILARYHGYAGQLTQSGDQNSGQTLEATIRVPAASLDAALIELRKLGTVTREVQNGEDVTMQHADLTARLANARESERRLLEILRTRTGKVREVLEVEQQISETREGIERMEAEEKALTGRVSFSSVTLTITEDFQAKLNNGRPSVGTKLRNALVTGLGDARDMTVSLLVWLISVGPSLLIWALILILPLRWLWRRAKAFVLAREASTNA